MLYNKPDILYIEFLWYNKRRSTFGLLLYVLCYGWYTLDCDIFKITEGSYRERLPISPHPSGYPNKTNTFTGKIISKLGLRVCCIGVYLYNHDKHGHCTLFIQAGTGDLGKTGYRINMGNWILYIETRCHSYKMRMVSYIEPLVLSWTTGSTYATPGGSI